MQAMGVKGEMVLWAEFLDNLKLKDDGDLFFTLI